MQSTQPPSLLRPMTPIWSNTHTFSLNPPEASPTHSGSISISLTLQSDLKPSPSGSLNQQDALADSSISTLPPIFTVPMALVPLAPPSMFPLGGLSMRGMWPPYPAPASKDQSRFGRLCVTH